MSQVNGGGGSGGTIVNSVTGTANQVTAAPTTGDVILSTPSVFIAPGSIASTSTNSAGTQFLAANGTELLPSYSFTSTPTAGFFLSNANEIDLTWAAGLQTVRFLSSQTIFDNNLSTAGTAQIVMQNGSIGAPSLVCANDTTTGIYSDGVGSFRIASNSIPSATFQQAVNTFHNNSRFQGAIFVEITTPGAYPYTVLSTDYMVIVDTTSARTINLPAGVAPFNPMVVIVKDNTGGALVNNITISGNGANIDGSATASIITNYGSLTFVWNGTQWNIVSKV